MHHTSLSLQPFCFCYSQCHCHVDVLVLLYHHHHHCSCLPFTFPLDFKILRVYTWQGCFFRLHHSTSIEHSALRSNGVPDTKAGKNYLQCSWSLTRPIQALQTHKGLRSARCYRYKDRIPQVVIIILFEAISAVKSAYIKLQKAHIPYDPANIAFTDEIITSELDSVTALECLCSTSGGVGPLINERWSLVQELEAETRKKESDIALLRRELEGLQRANSTLNKQIKRRQLSVKHEKVFVVPKQLTTPSAFLEMFKVASTSVQDFAELITSLMASSSEHRVRNAEEQSCKKYSLEACLSRTMLAGATEEQVSDSDGLERIMRSCDPLDALMEDPRSGFSRFCRLKYPAAVSSEMESAMFRNQDQGAFVSRGGHPRTWFYRAFATMARSTWALQVVMMMMNCFAHDVRMFYAKKGCKYAEGYMESVAAPSLGKEEEKLSVAFTVTPGFKIGDTVVACRVFLCHPEDANGSTDPKFR